MASLTLHNLEPELEEALRRKASQLHTSLNRTAQQLLSQSLGLEKGMTQKSDFSDLAGTWSESQAREFEASVADFSAIDQDLWK